MIGRRQLLGGLAAVALAPLVKAQQTPRISVQGSPVQGYPLFVAVIGDESLGEPRLEWERKEYPLSWVSSAGAWRAVLPISIDCAAGQMVRLKQPTGTLLERALTVKARNYGTQYLTLSPVTLAGYDNPQNKADDLAILASMEKLDGQQRWKGSFHLPCQAPETTGFGQRRLYNGWKKGWHKGLDLGGWEGQTVTAPAAGKVVHQARGIVNGNTLVISHGLGVFSVFFHLTDFAVGPGESVELGQSIATVGGSGGFAPHLHWEMRAFGVPVHPKAFLQLPADWQ